MRILGIISTHYALLTTQSPLFSVYGSADTDLIGAESLASVAIRKLLHRHKFLSKQMGFSRTFPHFFHFMPKMLILKVLRENCVLQNGKGIPSPL